VSFGDRSQVCELIGEMVRLAPSDHWRFARFAHDLRADDVLLARSCADRETEVAALRAEFTAHRAAVAHGPRIGVARSSHPYLCGVTLLFADRQTEFGILTLLRTSAQFHSAEIRLLTLALCSACEQLSAAHLPSNGSNGSYGTNGATAPKAPRRRDQAAGSPRTDSVMYVLERERLDVVLSEPGGAQRLPVLLESTVRELTASWTEDPASQREGLANPLPFLRLRTQPLAGRNGAYIGVLIDGAPARDSLAGAAARYEISPRESQVLALLLDGSSLAEIACELHITSSTVQDHVKSLLHKTNAQNRSSMIAKVFGWRNP